LEEAEGRAHDKDTLAAYRGTAHLGPIGNYPNFMLNVRWDRIDAIAGASHAVRTPEDFLESP